MYARRLEPLLEQCAELVESHRVHLMQCVDEPGLNGRRGVAQDVAPRRRDLQLHAVTVAIVSDSCNESSLGETSDEDRHRALMRRGPLREFVP